MHPLHRSASSFGGLKAFYKRGSLPQTFCAVCICQSAHVLDQLAKQLLHPELGVQRRKQNMLGACCRGCWHHEGCLLMGVVTMQHGCANNKMNNLSLTRCNMRRSQSAALRQACCACWPCFVDYYLTSSNLLRIPWPCRGDHAWQGQAACRA